MVRGFVLRRLDTREFETSYHRNANVGWTSKLGEDVFVWSSLEWAKNQQACYQTYGIHTEIIDLERFEVLW